MVKKQTKNLERISFEIGKHRDYIYYHAHESQFIMNILLSFTAILISAIFFVIVYMNDAPAKDMVINVLFAVLFLVLISSSITVLKHILKFNRQSKNLFSYYKKLEAGA